MSGKMLHNTLQLAIMHFVLRCFMLTLVSLDKVTIFLMKCDGQLCNYTQPHF